MKTKLKNIFHLAMRLVKSLQFWYDIKSGKPREIGIQNNCPIFSGWQMVEELKDYIINLDPKRIFFALQEDGQGIWCYPYQQGYLLSSVGSRTIVYAQGKQTFEAANKYRRRIKGLGTTDYTVYLMCDVIGLEMRPYGVFVFKEELIDRPLRVYHEQDVSFPDALADAYQFAHQLEPSYILKAKYEEQSLSQPTIKAKKKNKKKAAY